MNMVGSLPSLPPAQINLNVQNFGRMRADIPVGDGLLSLSNLVAGQQALGTVSNADVTVTLNLYGDSPEKLQIAKKSIEDDIQVLSQAQNGTLFTRLKLDTTV